MFNNVRGVAQPGSVLVWGARGRGFKSRHPDDVNGLICKIRPFFIPATLILAVNLAELAALITEKGVKNIMAGTKGKYHENKYIKCRLQDYGGDMSKEWFIIYYIWNPEKCKLVRKRISAFNHGNDTARKRRAAAVQIMAKIDHLLENGAVTMSAKKLEEENKKFNVHSANIIQGLKYAIEQKKSDGLEKKTVEDSLRALELFEIFLKEEGKEKIQISAVTPDLLYLFSDFLMKKGYSPKTHNNYKGYLSSAYSFFLERYPQIFRYNPFFSVKNKKVESGGHTPFSPTQMEKLKKEMLKMGMEKLHLFTQFIYYGFVRPGKELRFLQIKHLREYAIFIPPEIAKNDRGEYVKISATLEKLIKKHKLREYPEDFYIFSKCGFADPKTAHKFLQGKLTAPPKFIAGFPGSEPTGVNYFYKQHVKVLKALKYNTEDHDLYCYKHSGNIQLFLSGAKLEEIKKQNRHTSLTQTEEYLKDLGLFVKDNLEEHADW